MVLVGERARGLERRVGIGVERVRGHRRNHQRVVAEPLEEALGELQGVGGRFGVGHREADNGLAQHAAHPGFLGHFRRHVLEVVHVGKGGGSAEQHFQRGQARAPADEVGRYVLGLGGEDELVQPVLQIPVVGDAAEQRHGGVRVGIDEAGRQDGVGAVDALLRLEARVDGRLGPDSHDALAANGDGAVLDDAVLRVLGDEIAAAPDPIDRLRRQRANEEEEATDTKHRKASGRVPSDYRSRSCLAGSPG